jgi:hypothetical protein
MLYLIKKHKFPLSAVETEMMDAYSHGNTKYSAILSAFYVSAFIIIIIIIIIIIMQIKNFVLRHNFEKRSSRFTLELKMRLRLGSGVLRFRLGNRATPQKKVI